MTDINLKTIASGYNLSKINDNFETIEDVINDEIVHTTGGNNTMAQELDMNSYRILNLPVPVGDTEPLRKGDITVDTTGATVQYVDDSIEVATLPQTINFGLVTSYENYTEALPVGKIVYILERNARFTVISGTGTATGYRVIANTTVGQSAELIEGNEVWAEQFGAVNDIGVQSTVPLQEWLDSPVPYKRVGGGSFAHGNLTIPNVRMHIKGGGHEITAFECIAPANADYGIAQSSYVDNSTTANVPILIEGIRFDGNENVLNPVVLYTFFSTVHECRFMNAALGGYSLVLSGNGISGSVSGTTQVENQVIKCRLGGGAGDAFRVKDTNARQTDGMFRGNLCMLRDSVWDTMAGWVVSNNHYYGGDVYYNKLSVGTTIGTNFYENDLITNNYLDENVSMSNETFTQQASFLFGSNGKVMTLNGCKWQGAGSVLHDFFASDKNLIINGGSFESASFFNFSNPGSTGWIRANRVFDQLNDRWVTGARQAAGSSLRQEMIRTAPDSVFADRGNADKNLFWGSDDITNIWASSLTVTRTASFSLTRAESGAKFRIVRTAAGAGSLNLDTAGALGTLAQNEWADVEFNGTAWLVTARGSLV